MGSIIVTWLSDFDHVLGELYLDEDGKLQLIDRDKEYGRDLADLVERIEAKPVEIQMGETLQDGDATVHRLFRHQIEAVDPAHLRGVRDLLLEYTIRGRRIIGTIRP